MNTREFLSRLDGVKKQGDGWMARCPAHADKTPSLRVGEGDDGRIVLNDFGGCDPGAVVAAMGLTMADLFAERRNGNGRVIEATYDYRDEGGKLLFQAIRYNPKDFRQRRPDGNGGWIYRLDSVRRVLYRLPELASSDPTTPVFLVEGEKDVDRLRAGGLVATCSPMGAGKWRQEYADSLVGRDVIIIPDNDPQGRDHAKAEEQSLRGLAASVKILTLSGLPDKGDVSNWLDSGHTIEELKALAEAADVKADGQSDDAGDFGPGFYSSLRELHLKETVPADDLMIGVRRRQVTIFASVTSVGKTTIMLNHSLAAAGGQSWAPLLPTPPERPLKIVFIDAESTDDELKKDTQTMLATIGNATLAAENFIPVVDAQIDGEALNLSNPKHFDQVKRFLQYHQPDIAIFDTVSSLFTLYSENDNAEVVRKVIRPLKELAIAGNCAVWASHHIGKAGESDQAEEAYRGRGASAFGANVRGVITLMKEKALGDGYVRLTLGKSKGNKLDPVNLKLDFARRTFELCATAPQVQTPYAQVISVFNGKPLKSGDVKKLLKEMSGATVDRALREALKNGDLFKTTHGAYERPNPASSTSSHPIGMTKLTKSSEPVENVVDSELFDEWDEKGDDEGGDPYGDLQNNPDWRDE